MAAPASNSTGSSNMLSTHRDMLDAITAFLTVATHQILFLRRLYPALSFLSARAYNYPVRQNRHPRVCAWVNDAVAAVRAQLERNTVEKVSLCIFECRGNRVLERWTFDLRSFPTIAPRDHDIPFDAAEDDDDEEEEEDLLARKINLADLDANFRATLSRIGTAAGRLRPLPEGPGAPECSFSLVIELKDNADRPVGRLEKDERLWMAAESNNFLPPDSDPGSAKTHAVRRLEAGELRIEVWVEEAAAKFEFPAPAQTSGPSASADVRRATMSYGAGTEKFDPENGYDLEPRDVNRKPQGGAMTDYQLG